MKRTVLQLLLSVFSLMLINAEGVVELATKSGYVQNAGDKTVFYDANIKLKYITKSWARVGYVEVPVSESSAANLVEFKVYFYKSSASGDFQVQFASMNGSLPVDLGFTSQPDESSLTVLGTKTVNGAAEGWLSVDITTQYNAAITAGESALSIRMQSSDDAETMLEFYSLATGTSNKPHIEVSSNCPKSLTEVDTVLVEGESLQVGDMSYTESGIYIDSAFTACGADSITTYYALFIKNEEVIVDTAICDGDVLSVVTGPRSTKTYSDAGTYRDTITAANGQQVTVTNLSLNALPEPQDLGDDQEIREGEETVLDAGDGFAAYQWYNNGKIINGATNQTLTVDVENSSFVFGINEVSVEVTNANGCRGADDVWVEIVGNFIHPEKDMYLEEAGDRQLDISRLEVKYDTWGDVSLDVPAAPYYTKEIYLAFDLGLNEIPAEAENMKLKMYMYGLAGNSKQSSPDTTLSINCDYTDGLYGDDMIWTTRTEVSERTPLAQALSVNPTMINTHVEWDINDVFVSDILGKKNQFTIILSVSNDAYSLLAKFKDMANNNVGWRPSITFQMPETSDLQEIKLDAKVVLAPNPVENMIYICGEEKFTTATVYSLQGQLLLASQLEDNSIDVTRLASGHYIVKLSNSQRSVSQMIIKK